MGVVRVRWKSADFDCEFAMKEGVGHVAVHHHGAPLATATVSSAREAHDRAETLIRAANVPSDISGSRTGT